MALYAAAWLDVAGAYTCTEYSGSGTETVRPPIKDSFYVRLFLLFAIICYNTCVYLNT